MRKLALIALAACSIPDKQPLTTDGGLGDAWGEEEPGGTPDTRITSAPPAFSNSATATFEFEANQQGVRFECSVDGEPFAPCTSPFSRTLADGTHSFAVRAINGGDGDNSPAEHLWSIDTVAPETTLTGAPPAADNSTQVVFTFMSNEMNVTFECSLDGSAFATCRSGDEFGPISDGTHSFAVRARDRAGNVDASPAIHARSVDTSTPDTTIISGPSGAVGSSSATFSFLSPDAGGGARFECSLDGAPFTSCESPITYTNLAMGVHTFAVRVRDANGNLDPTPATRTWTVDLTPPETTITSAPSGTVAMASASIAFTANELDVTYECSLDGGPWTACTSPFNATNLAQGPHAFAVRATDMAGNTDPTPATANWTVDTVTPELAITSGPGNGETTGPRVTFTWTVNEGTVTCRFDEQSPWMPCASPFAFNAPEGATQFFVRATDPAGNTTMLSRSWAVDCDPPSVMGAAGLLRLDNGDQVQGNETGGPAATLGPTDQAEPQDPAFVATGRFGGALAFDPAQGDLVAWPLALGATPAFTFDVWVRPEPATGARDVLVTGDGRVAIRVSSDTADTVRFTATVVDNVGAQHSVTSASYPARQWHNVVASHQDPTLRLWVDGDRSENTTALMATSPSFDALRLGGNLLGQLDEIWVAQGALTTDDAVLGRYCPATTIRS
jgi:hypothetical protein